MSETAAKAFVERLMSDEGFAERLAAAPTAEERQRLANEAGYDVTPDDIAAIKSHLGIEELADEDLERVAGGGDVENSVITAVISGLAAASAVASALI